jgi:tetratricopeptide (TPR) repeat protein
LRRKAGCLVTLERNREAMDVYREVLELSPDHADSLLELGILYREMNALNRAIALLSRARQLLPHRSSYALALGNTLVMAGSVEAGVTELEAAVVQKPCSVRIRSSLAAALMKLGRLREAAQQAQAGLRLEPSNIQLRQIAATLMRQGIRPPERESTYP